MAKTSALMTCLAMSVLLLVVVICGAASVRAAPAVEEDSQGTQQNPSNLETSELVRFGIKIKAKYGRVEKYRRFLPNTLQKVTEEEVIFLSPKDNGDCHVTFVKEENGESGQWVCDKDTTDTCTRGLAIVNKKESGSSYRLEKFKNVEARMEKNALMAFCPAKDIVMTKKPWMSTYFWAKTDLAHPKNKTFYLKLKHNQRVSYAKVVVPDPAKVVVQAPQAEKRRASV